jgi:hypothetical protein
MTDITGDGDAAFGTNSVGYAVVRVNVSTGAMKFIAWAYDGIQVIDTPAQGTWRYELWSVFGPRTDGGSASFQYKGQSDITLLQARR